MNWLKFIALFAVTALLTAAPLWGDEATDQFNALKKTFDAKDYASARTGFETFLTRFPAHAKTNEATFYLAESLLYLQRYEQAKTYFTRLTALGTNDLYARAALFRLAEIPYMQGQYDVAKPLLGDFVEKYNQDANLQFVLYYLGDIAMRSNADDAADEAEWYFEMAERMFSQGAKSLECKLGLAWAKNKLEKQTEANEIYRQLMNSSNLAIVEQATYQYGMALFERGSFQDAINTLTVFQSRYPASTYLTDSKRVIARCKARLNDYEGALQTIAQIVPPAPDDLLLKVHCLHNLKRTQEAKTALDEVKRTAGSAYRDEIALYESGFLFEQRNWQEVIALLEKVLVPQFDLNNNRMVVNYFSIPVTSGTKKLRDLAIFRACSLLTLAYAQSGDTAKANALYNEMQTQAGLSGQVKQIAICTDTGTQLASIGNSGHGTTPGRRPGWGGFYGGGSFAGSGRGNGQFGGNTQWTPPSSGSVSNLGTLSPLETGTDLQKFWQAERLYRTKKYEGAVQQLEQILSGYYNQIAIPPQYSLFYNITNAEGTLNEQTFIRACSLLALSKAQLGDMEQASAVFSAFAAKAKMNDLVQQNLVQETSQQLNLLATNGRTTGSEVATLTETEQRKLLRDANTLFRQKRYDQVDAKATELIAANPDEAVLTEVLLLQGKTKYGLGRDQEGVTILERIIDEFSTSNEYPDALWYLGLYFESGGDSLQSLEYFQILADSFPSYKNIDGALYFLAANDLSNGNARQAVSYLKRIYQSHRNGTYWSHAAWLLAYEAYKKKQFSQAEVYVQEILRHPPDKVVLDRVLYLQGELSLRKKDYQSAFLAFREVGNLCPDSPLSHYATRNAQIAASKTASVPENLH